MTLLSEEKDKSAILMIISIYYICTYIHVHVHVCTYIHVHVHTISCSCTCTFVKYTSVSIEASNHRDSNNCW